MTPSVHFLGVGDATCAEGPNASVLYVGEQTLLVDCGPTVPQPFFCTLDDPDALDAIWITHQHADHCFGLPTLLLRLRLLRRQKPLEIFGGPGSMQFVRAGLELGYPGSFRPEKCFPITYTEVEPGQSIRRGEVRLTTARSQHRVACHALRIDDGNHALCVSGDGKPTPATLRLYDGATLAIHECEWAARESEDHSNVADLRTLLEQARVERLAIVHCNDAERRAIGALAARQLGDRAWLPNPRDVTTLP